LHQQLQRQLQIQPRLPPRQPAPVKKKRAGVGKFASRLIMGNHVQTDYSRDDSAGPGHKPTPQGPPLEVTVNTNEAYDAEIHGNSEVQGLSPDGPIMSQQYDDEIFEYPPEYSLQQHHAAAPQYASQYAAQGDFVQQSPSHNGIPQYAPPNPHYNSQAQYRQGQYASPPSQYTPTQTGRYPAAQQPYAQGVAYPDQQGYLPQSQHYLQHPHVRGQQMGMLSGEQRARQLAQQRQQYIPPPGNRGYEQHIRQQQAAMAFEQQQRHEEMMQRQHAAQAGMIASTGHTGGTLQVRRSPQHRPPPGGNYDYSTEYSSSNDIRNVNYDEYDYSSEFTPRSAPRPV